MNTLTSVAPGLHPPRQLGGRDQGCVISLLDVGAAVEDGSAHTLERCSVHGCVVKADSQQGGVGEVGSGQVGVDEPSSSLSALVLPGAAGVR